MLNRLKQIIQKFLGAELHAQFNRASVNNKGKNIVNTYDNQKYLINIYIHIVTR